MSLLRTLAMTFSMFSALPMPQVEWKKENMRFTLAALPLVGVTVGLIVRCWLWLAGALGLGGALSAAGMTLLPLCISGGIHLDGFCDTADALASRAAPEKKRAILKDPHAGAFAVIWVCAYLLAYFALCTELGRNARTLWLFSLVPVASRALGSLASACFPAAGSPGLLTAFRDASGRAAVAILCVWLLACGAALLLLSPLAGGAMLLAGAACALLVYRIAKTDFGGMSGDLAGFLIALCELTMLAALVFAGKAVL